MKTQILLAALFCATAGSSVWAQSTPPWDSPDAIAAKSTRIEIKNPVEVSVDIPGTIIKMTPDFRGGVVKAGDVVVELDSRLVRAQLKEAKAKAESTVLIKFAEHAKELAEFKVKSRKERNAVTVAKAGVELYTPDEIRELELDAVKAGAELEKALEDKLLATLAMETKQTELEQYTRTASISGIVTDLNKKSVGSGVRQGDPIMTIVNLDVVIAALTLDPVHERRINIGNTVLVRRTSTSGGETLLQGSLRNGDPKLASVQPPSKADEEVFVGKVVFIRPVKLADSGNSFEIEAEIQNKAVGPGKYLLREGSFVEAVVISPQQ